MCVCVCEGLEMCQRVWLCAREGLYKCHRTWDKYQKAWDMSERSSNGYQCAEMGGLGTVDTQSDMWPAYEWGYI